MKTLATLICMGLVSYSFAQTATVLSEQKISDTQGNFLETMANSDKFGNSVAGIGDLDGDGVEDLVVGADGQGVGGSIYVLFMNSDGTVSTSQQITEGVGGMVGNLDGGDDFGYSVASIGDLDNDGVVDLVVGSEEDSDDGSSQGAVWILFLNTDGTVKAEQKINESNGGFTGTLDVNDRFGYAVAGIGDLNDDGNEDIAVGALLDDDGGNGRGAVWILFLNTDGTVASHQKISDTFGGFSGVVADTDNLGSAVAGLGDLDGDGIEDIAVGAYLDDDGATNSGAVYIMFLNSNGTVSSYQKISNTTGGFTGSLGANEYWADGGMANMGDLDGDGIIDLAVGESWDGDGGAGKGSVWTLFLDTDGTVSGHQKISETTGGFVTTLDSYDLFGRGIANIGDLDGDGKTDMAVGAPFDDDGGSSRGAVYILNLEGVASFSGTVTAQTNVPCADDCTGSATVAPVGGTGPFSYLWSGGGTSSTKTGLCAGSHTVTITDGALNTTVVNVDITVLDATNPVIGCPGDQTESLDASCTFTLPDYTALVTATDDCGAVTLTQSPVSGTVISVNTTITMTATDGNGNTSTCTFDVLLDDDTAPTTVCQNIDVYLDGSGNASIVAADLDDGSSDNCSGVTLTASQTTFTCADLGTNNVTLTATDDDGNSSDCIAVVTVLDTISPTASNPAAITAECIDDVPASDVLLVTDEADNCSATPTVTFVSDVSDGGSCPEIITRTYSVEDESGNSINVTQTITINDLTAPVADVTALADITGECSISMPAAPTATDNCSGTVSATTDASFPITEMGTTVITWTYTDDCGNETTQTQNAILTPIDNGITQVDAATLMADATGYNYQWIDCDNGNTPIVGSTSQSFTPSVAGNYACIVDNGECSDTTDCLGSSVGIAESGFGNDFVVYPNPTAGDLKVNLGGVYSEINLKVFNALGEVIMTESFGTATELNLEIAGAAGMYILEITTAMGESARVNVVKE
ncbi:MAG: FG-GAP-like repeat-containing protein [Flavobacteriales bacterium]|nr:FG-GAP-like repeat-containing protein [Flavobacteriales bacterium]